MDLLFIELYILIAAVCIFLLLVAASKYTDYDWKLDVPYPVLCGILWPIAGPLAAAYIAAEYYLFHRAKDDE